jgi:putative peptidoglycan lipid II flippase
LNDEVKEARPAAMVRAAGTISALTLLSRVLGLVRDQVFAALLGAGVQADAFAVAFRVPNLLRDLFAEGALSAAFVPTYTAALHREGRARALALASRLLSVLCVGLGGVVVLGYFATGPLVAALAPGFGQIAGKTALTEQLTRVMLPFLPLVSFAAVAMGMLNAEERYVAPALAPSMFNVVAVLIGGGLALAGAAPERAVLGWAVGTVLGGLAQFAIQLPPLMRQEFRFRWEWAPDDPGLVRIAALMAPATIGLAAVQLNIFISSRFASHEPGAVAWLQFAFRLLYLPIGIFGVALGTIATTGLAKSAALADTETMRHTLVRGLRLIVFLCLPATLGLIAVGRPVIRMIYQHGRFVARDTEGTAAALSLYAIGLVAYTGVKVVAPAFYALGRPSVALGGSALAVVTNLAVIAALQARMGFRAVALGTSLGSIVNVGVLLVVFHRSVGALRGHGLFSGSLRVLFASLPMAAAAFWTAAALEAGAEGGGVGQAAAGLVPVVVGVLAYAACARLLRLPELELILAAARGRS